MRGSKLAGMREPQSSGRPHVVCLFLAFLEEGSRKRKACTFYSAGHVRRTNSSVELFSEPCLIEATASEELGGAGGIAARAHQALRSRKGRRIRQEFFPSIADPRHAKSSLPRDCCDVFAPEVPSDRALRITVSQEPDLTEIMTTQNCGGCAASASPKWTRKDAVPKRGSR